MSENKWMKVLKTMSELLEEELSRRPAPNRLAASHLRSDEDIDDDFCEDDAHDGDEVLDDDEIDDGLDDEPLDEGQDVDDDGAWDRDDE